MASPYDAVFQAPASSPDPYGAVFQATPPAGQQPLVQTPIQAVTQPGVLESFGARGTVPRIADVALNVLGIPFRAAGETAKAVTAYGAAGLSRLGGALGLPVTEAAKQPGTYYQLPLVQGIGTAAEMAAGIVPGVAAARTASRVGRVGTPIVPPRPQGAAVPMTRDVPVSEPEVPPTRVGTSPFATPKKGTTARLPDSATDAAFPPPPPEITPLPPSSGAKPIARTAFSEATKSSTSQPSTYLLRQGAGGEDIVYQTMNVDRAADQIKRGIYDAAQSAKLPRLSATEAANFAAVRETGAAPLNPKVAKWVEFWSPVLDKELPSLVEGSGLHRYSDEASKYLEWAQRPNYMPKQVNWQAVDALPRSDPNRYTQLLNAIQASQNLAGRSDAEIWLANRRLFGAQERIAGFQHVRENFEWPAELLVRADQAVFDHAASVGRRVAEARYFGPNDENLLIARQQIAKDGGDSAYAANAVDRLLRRTPKPSEQLTSLADVGTNLAALTSMGPRSTVRQVQQVLNSALLTNWSSLAKGIGSIFTPEGKAALTQIAAHTGKESTAGMITGREGALGNAVNTWLQFNRFTPMDLRWRDISGLVGRSWGQQLVQEGGPAARAAFRRAGIDLDAAIAQGPTGIAKAVNDLGWWVANEAQFGTKSLSSPAWTGSPLGRTVMALRNFDYRTTSFYYQNLVREARKDPVKVATWLAATQGVGEVTQDTLSVATGATRALAEGRMPTYKDFEDALRERPDSLYLRMIGNQIGGMGGSFITRAIEIANRSETSRDFANNIAREIPGVIISKGLDLAGAGVEAVHRAVAGADPYAQLFARAARAIIPPPLGGAIAERIRPPRYGPGIPEDLRQRPPRYR